MTTMTAETTDQLLTVRQVAERLGVSERTVWTLRSEGALPSVRMRGSTRWRASDVQDYIDSLSDRAAA